MVNGDDLYLTRSTASSPTPPTPPQEEKPSTSSSPTKGFNAADSTQGGRKLSDKEQRECAVIGMYWYLIPIPIICCRLLKYIL